MKEEELVGELNGPEHTTRRPPDPAGARPSRTEASPRAEMGDPPVSATNFRRLTDILLIVTPVTFSLFFALLQATFNYPAILNAPAGDVLTRFHDGGAALDPARRRDASPLGK